MLNSWVKGLLTSSQRERWRRHTWNTEVYWSWRLSRCNLPCPTLERTPNRRHFQNGGKQNGDTPKTATTKTTTRQNQNGDKSKTATRQNGDKFKTAFLREIKLDLSPFWFCRVAVLVVAVLGVSPFWRVAVLDVSPFWVSPFWKCRRFGCRRFGSVAILVVAVLEVSPFWIVAVLTGTP